MNLGHVQLAVLEDLRLFGGWSRGHGWTWDNASGTTRIVESLVKKGLAKKEDDTYTITEEGCSFLKNKEK